MSEPLSSVDWKLNELLAADRRAREYAQQSGQREMVAQKPFAPWEPRALDAGSADQSQQVTDTEADPQSVDGEHDQGNSPGGQDHEPLEPAPEPEPDFDAMLADARSAGERSGYARASEELAQQHQQQREQLQQLVAAINNTQVDLTDYVDFVRDLAAVIAEHVVRQELLSSSERMRDLVQSAVNRLTPDSAAELEIRANQRTLDSLTEALAGLDLQPALHHDESLGDGDFHFKLAATEGAEVVADKIRSVVDSLFCAEQQPQQDAADCQVSGSAVDSAGDSATETHAEPADEPATDRQDSQPSVQELLPANREQPQSDSPGYGMTDEAEDAELQWSEDDSADPDGEQG